MTLDAGDELRNLFHDEFRVFGQLGVMSDTATILHANTVSHDIVHVKKQIEKCGL